MSRSPFGGRGLSPREKDVVRLLVEEGLGATTGEIAQELGISERTVKAYLSRIYYKFGVPLQEEMGMPRIRLAYWWNCELFQLGLKETGILAASL